MGCSEYGVQPTDIQNLIEVTTPCTHINTGLLKADEAKLCECEIFPQGQRAVIRVDDLIQGWMRVDDLS